MVTISWKHWVAKVNDLDWKYTIIHEKYTIFCSKYTIFYSTILKDFDFLFEKTSFNKSIRSLGSYTFSHDRIFYIRVFANEKSKSSRIVNFQIKDRAANNRIFFMNDRLLSVNDRINVKIVYFSNSIFPTDCYHSQSLWN